MNFEETFRASLRESRKERGWSQTHLANLLGVSYQYIGKLERGERTPQLSTLEAIATALNVTPNDLLLDSAADPAIQ